MTSPKLEHVFGVSREQVLSYHPRTRVDGMFKDALKTDKQIIVYGSSKQGKTALVDKHLPYQDNIVIRCTPESELIDIYRSLLRKLEIEVVSEKESGSSSGIHAGVGMKFRALIPFLGAGEATAQGDMSSKNENVTKSAPIEFNLALPEDVADLIKKTGTKKHVVLENFHYLNNDTQKDLAFDLRTFQELGVRFIILGVWREKNRLTQFNGDLVDRIIEVPVEPWEKTEFESVIKNGENELNLKFSQPIIDKTINNAFDSIGVLQELLKTICKKNNVTERRDTKTIIDSVDIVDESIGEKAVEYSSRHIRALEDIAEGRKASRPKGGLAPLYLPYYTVKAFLNFEFSDIVSGIRRDKLEKAIKAKHHRAADVRPGDMSNLLHNFAKLQSEKNIVPPIFDYDQSTRTMKVVDSTFYFFIRNTDREEILKNLIDPLQQIEEQSPES